MKAPFAYDTMTIGDAIRGLSETPEVKALPPAGYRTWRANLLRVAAPSVFALHSVAWAGGFRVNGFNPHG